MWTGDNTQRMIFEAELVSSLTHAELKLDETDEQLSEDTLHLETLLKSEKSNPNEVEAVTQSIVDLNRYKETLIRITVRTYNRWCKKYLSIEQRAGMGRDIHELFFRLPSVEHAQNFRNMEPFITDSQSLLDSETFIVEAQKLNAHIHGLKDKKVHKEASIKKLVAQYEQAIFDLEKATKGLGKLPTELQNLKKDLAKERDALLGKLEKPPLRIQIAKIFASFFKPKRS